MAFGRCGGGWCAAAGAAGLPRRLADRDEAVLAAEVVKVVVHVALDKELVQDGHQRRVIQQLLSRAALAVAAGVDVANGLALGPGKDAGQHNPALGVHLEELLVGDGAHGDRLVGGMVAFFPGACAPSFVLCSLRTEAGVRVGGMAAGTST